MKHIKLFEEFIDEAWSASDIAKQGSRKAIYKFIYSNGEVATWFDDSFGKTWRSAEKEMKSMIKYAKEWGWHKEQEAPNKFNIGILDTRNNRVHHSRSFRWDPNSVKIDKSHSSSTMTTINKD